MALLGRSAGVFVVAATTKEQGASELLPLEHGVFTYAVLEGLRGGADRAPADEIVTARELVLYTDEKVPAICEQYKLDLQYPVIYSEGMDFPLVVTNGVTK